MNNRIYTKVLCIKDGFMNNGEQFCKKGDYYNTEISACENLKSVDTLVTKRHPISIDCFNQHFTENLDYIGNEVIYITCGRNAKGELFITNIENYLYSEEIILRYHKINDGIWVSNELNKYQGYDFYYLPEQASEVRQLCEKRLKEIVEIDIIYYKAMISNKEAELDTIPLIECSNLGNKNILYWKRL